MAFLLWQSIPRYSDWRLVELLKKYNATCCLQSCADVLFILNYPKYVIESVVNPDYPNNNPGLGYQYTSEQVSSKIGDIWL